MAGKFVELKEAASILGMTTEELVELRAEGGIHGYRDGGSWKFKAEEVERVATERGISANVDGTESDSESSAELDDLISLSELSDSAIDDLSSDSSILVSEEELGGVAPDAGASSTVIGANKNADSAESDIQLSEDSTGGSQIMESSDVALNPESSDVGGGSSLIGAKDGGTGDLALSSSDLDIDLDSNDDEAIDSSELELSDDSDFQLSSDDLILTSSGGSDVTLGTGDSGINLSSPSDSGLSLEDEVLDLSDSSSSGLELPEDASEIIALDDSLSDSLPDLKEGDFLLSPSDELSSDESDSGSQVIALEDSEAFDSSQALLEPVDQPALIPEDNLEQDPAFAALDAGAAPVDPAAEAATPAGAPAGGFAPPAPAQEAPYSIWNVLGLMLIFAILTLTGTMMFDIVRNMWGWDSNLHVSSTIMDSVIDMMGMNK